MHRTRPAAAIALSAALALTALPGVATAAPQAPQGSAAASYSPALRPSVSRVVAKNLNAPWGMAFISSTRALVAERNSGRIKRLDGNGGVRTVGRVSGVVAAGEGGLMGLAVPRNFSTSRWVYAYFTARNDNRIVRMKYSGGKLGRAHLVLKGIPKGFIHNGGRIAFGPDGMLYAGTGEAGNRSLSQNSRSLGGKILRMTPTGGVPSNNPRSGSLVYSKGHRNVQGLAFDSSGRLFAAEFGQNTWDELNLIKPGRNYGWPIVEGTSTDRRFVNPVAKWRTDKASPSGIAIVRDTVFMAGLRGKRLWRIQIGSLRSDGNPRTRSEDFFIERFGRLRTVTAAPDGSLWLSTSNTDGRGRPTSSDDRVLRIRLRS